MPEASSGTIDGLMLAHTGRGAAVMTPRGALSFAELARAAERLAAEQAAGSAAGAVAIAGLGPSDCLGRFYGAIHSGRPAAILDGDDPALAAKLADLRPAFLMQGQADAQPAVALFTNDPRAPLPGEFYWAFSSGTTGAPKSFARTHASWLASMSICESAIPLREQDVMGVPGPLSHSLFLFGAVHGLSRGLSVAITGAFQPRAVVRHFAASGVTVLYVVPAMLRALLDAGPARWQPRLVFCGGAKLDEALRAAAEAAWPRADIVEFYGSSELSFVSWASTAQPAPPGSVGQPFSGVDLRVGDDMGGGGLIEVRSPMVFSRYLDGPPVMPGAWLTAGDTGRLCDGGFLYVTGRQARIINTAGVKIAAEPIEQALASWDGVAAAAVIGLPDARRGEVVSAFVVPGTGFDSAALRVQVRAKLPPRHRPRRLFVTNDLPRTRSGKVAVAELKAMAEAGDARLQEIR